MVVIARLAFHSRNFDPILELGAHLMMLSITSQTVRGKTNRRPPMAIMRTKTIEIPSFSYSVESSNGSSVT